jgi:hypothetical protein
MKADQLPDAVFKVRVSIEPDAPAESWNGEGLAGVLVKSDGESRYTLTVAYPANKPDVAVARDGNRDFANKQEVEKAAWNYLTNSQNVGLWHENGTDGAGRVVESYIYRGPDWTIKADGNEYVVKAGDWLTGIIWDEPGWQLIKEGKIGGVSMQGKAQRRTPSPADLANLRKNSA